jgi:hypothetical protein
MSHIHSHHDEQISLCSIPALQLRHDSITIPASHLGASLLGSASACLEIGHRVRYNEDFVTATRCIGSSLLPLTDEFYGMHSAFRDIQCPTRSVEHFGRKMRRTRSGMYNRLSKKWHSAFETSLLIAKLGMLSFRIVFFTSCKDFKSLCRDSN